MEPKIEALFKAMQQWGYVPKDDSLEDFASAHSDPAKQLELYNFLKSQGKVSMPPNDFVSSVFAPAPATEDVKKKEPGGQQSQQSQETSLASSSSSTAPAPTAGIVSKPIDPTEGFPNPQAESLSQIEPGGLPQAQPAVAPLDPTSPLAPKQEGGPTPDFGAIQQKEVNPLQYPGQEMAGGPTPAFGELPFQKLDGGEDIQSFGETYRKGLSADYDSKLKADQNTEFRAALRKAQNAELYGAEAVKQVKYAKAKLAEQFGPEWEKEFKIAGETLTKYGEAYQAKVGELETMKAQLEASKGKISPAAYNQAVSQYNAKIGEIKPLQDSYAKAQSDYEVYTNTPAFKIYTDGFAAYEKAYAEQESIQKSKAIQDVAAVRLVKQKGKEVPYNAITNSAFGEISDFAARTAGRLAVGIMSLPRTAGTALSSLTGLENEQGAASGDLMGKWADQLNEYVDTNFPKTSDRERSVFERVVPYGDGEEAVVNEAGELQAIYGKEGYKRELTKGEAEAFNKSGIGKKYEWGWTGAANTFDKTLDVAADLFIARGLGGGTKMGTAAATFTQIHAGAYDEAISQLEADPNEAAVYAATSAAIQGMIEAYVGNIETSFGKPGALGKAFSAKEGKVLMGKLGPMATAIARAQPVISMVAQENAEEFLQGIADKWQRAEFNERTGANLDTGWTKGEIMETVLLTTLVTAPLSATQSLGAVDDMRRKAIFSLSNNSGMFMKLTGEMVSSGNMTPEEAATLNDRAAKIALYAQRMPSTVTDDQKATALAKEWNRMEAESRSKAENVLPAQAAEAKKVAAQLQNEIVQDIQPKPEPDQVEQALEMIAEAEQTPIPLVPVNEINETEDLKVSKSTPLNERVVVEEQQPAGRAEPITVEQSLPPEFVQAETPTTVVAEAYANRDKASQLDYNDPAVQDEVANIAIQELKQRSYTPTPEETGAIRRFFVDSLADTSINQRVSVDDAFGSLADEYIDTVAKSNRPLRERFDPETVEDNIAAFFASGGKVSPESFDRWGDPNLRKDKSVTSFYFKKGARSIEDIANEWMGDEKVNTGTMSENDLINAFVDFMKAYGKKNVNDYLAPRVEAQELEKRKTSLKEQFGKREDFDEKYDEVEAELSAIEVTPQEEVAINGFIDDFVPADENGMVRSGALRDAIKRADADFNDPNFDAEVSKAWQALSPAARAALTNLAGGVEVKVAEKKAAKAETKEEGKSFQEWSQDYRNPDGSLDVEKIKQAWDAGGDFTFTGEVTPTAYAEIEKIVTDENYNEAASDSAGQQIQPTEDGATEELDTREEPYEAEERIQESFVEEANDAIREAEIAIATSEGIEAAEEGLKQQLQKAPAPDKLTPALVAEMMDQGILTVTEGNMLQAHLETGEAVEANLLAKAENGIVMLKEVPEWMGAWQRATLAHSAAIVSGAAMPGQLFVSEQPDGSLVVGNVQGVEQTLREAGAVKNGKGWFVPAESRDVVLAELNDHNVKFSMAKDSSYQAVAGAGSMAGAVVRFFASKFGEAQMRRLRREMAKAKTTDQRIAIAKRMTATTEPVRASKIARFLSDKFGIPLVMDQAMIAEALRQMGRTDLVENGVPSPVVRGFFWNGQVYMNMDVADTETGIHEYGHVFLEAIRGTELYTQFENAVRGSVYEQAVRDNPLYAGMTDAEILEEAMALAIGQRGAAITNPSAWMQFADTLDSMWAKVKSMFGIDVQNMKAREFADYVSTMMMSEADVNLEPGSNKMPAFLFGVTGPMKRKEVARALNSAMTMESDGVDPDKIWQTTGWFRGTDGFWRYEINDEGAGVRFVQDDLTVGNNIALADILDHPTLFNDYPQLADLSVQFTEGTGHFYTPLMGGLIGIDVTTLNDGGPVTSEQLLQPLIHETQHAIQEFEGLQGGGNIKSVETALADAMAYDAANPVPGVQAKLNAMKDNGAYAAYNALAGEVEARLAAARAGKPVSTAPMTMMDVAPENQFFFYPEDPEYTAQSMAERAADMDVEEVVDAKFLFGRNRVTDAAKIAAARGIIAAEIAGGVAPETSGVAVKLKKELGLSEKELIKLLAEEREATGSRMYVPSGARAFEGEVMKKVKEFWQRWFRPSKGLPKASWEALKKWHNEFRATMFRFDQKMKRLEDKVNKLTKGSDRLTNAVFQQINNVLNGTQDITTLDQSIQDEVMQTRKELDAMSRLLIESGAIQSPEMAFTIFRGAGIEMTPANKDWMKMVVSILRKAPNERTSDENLIVGKFFETYGDGIGNYLYRSYRINETPNWRERVPDEVKAKARNAIKRMITDKMSEEVQALQDKLEPLSDKVLELQDQIRKEIDVARGAVRTAKQELQDIIAKSSAYQARMGKPNKNFQKQEQAALKRLKALEQILRDADAAVSLPAADFMLLAEVPGFNTGGVNAVVRAIYARRKEIMKLEERVANADAASYERLQYLEAQLLDLDAQIDVILTKNDEVGREGLLTSGRLGSKSMSVIQGRRKDIPEEIRDLMGEYTDARVNVMRSVYRIANTIQAANFLFATRDAGIKEGWLSDVPRSKGAGGERLDTLVAPAGSAGMGPLAGLYTTAAIADAINSYNSVQKTNILARVYLYARGFIKRGLTVFSPASQGRNMWSNLFLATSMGWLNPVSVSSWRSFVKAMAYAKKTTFNNVLTESEAAFIEDAIKRGAVTRSVSQGDLKAAARFYDGLISEGYGNLPVLDAEVETKLGKYWGKGVGVAERAYESTDTMLKLWGYRVEIDKFASAIYKKKFDELTPEQQEDVKNRAAAVIAQVTPDYNMIPKVADIMRVAPMFSTFLAWQMEMYRTTVNRVNVGIAEIKDSRTRAIGIQRIALGSAYAASIFAAEIASAIAIGMDDEEREALINKFKPWERNSAKVFLIKDQKTNRLTGETDDEYTFYNLGQTDPYGFWKKPLLAMYNNSDSVGKSIDAGAEELYKQMFGTEILWAAAVQLYFDVNVQTKKQISMPGDISSFNQENIEERMNFIRKRMQPGFAKVVFDIYDSATVGSIDEYGNVKTPGTIALNAIGLQVNKVRPSVGFDKWLMGKSFEKNDIENFIKSKYSKAENNIKLAMEGDATKEQIDARRSREFSEFTGEYALMNEAYNRHLQEVGKEVREHISAFDVNPTIIIDKLKKRRYTDKEIAVILSENPITLEIKL